MTTKVVVVVAAVINTAAPAAAQTKRPDFLRPDGALPPATKGSKTK